jgi:hypothetical protein
LIKRIPIVYLLTIMPKIQFPKEPMDVDTLTLSEVRKYNKLLEGEYQTPNVTPMNMMLVRRKLIVHYPDYFFRRKPVNLK